jgi:hypothetical protein
MREDKVRMIYSMAICILIFSIPMPLEASKGDLFRHLSNKRYDYAIKKILRSGFEPVSVPDRRLVEGCIGFSRCSEYPELVNFVGKGIALCEFAFHDKKRNRYIRVMSYGETSKWIDSIYSASEIDLGNWGIRPR